MKHLCMKALVAIAKLGVASARQIILLSGTKNDTELNSILSELQNEKYIELSHENDFRITQFGFEWLKFMNISGDSSLNNEVVDAALAIARYQFSSEYSSITIDTIQDELGAHRGYIEDAVKLLTTLEIFIRVNDAYYERYKIDARANQMLNYLG